MATEMLTRRRVLQTAAVAASGLTVPLVRRAGAAVGSVPTGSMTLAWHTNIAPRWLDPQQHDGGATPDNFLNVLHDALIKNFRTELYEHPALADRFDFAEDAKSATFRLRPNVKFHDGSPVTLDVPSSLGKSRNASLKVKRRVWSLTILTPSVLSCKTLAQAPR